jgi:hypothetical protein
MDDRYQEYRAERGIVYVATIDSRYIEEAFLSAESVKRHCPTLSTTVFTDQPEHDLCSVGVFDQVFPASRALSVRLPWGEGQLNRLHALAHTTYRRTLHLDTDTVVVSSELISLFDMLDDVDIALVEASACDSYSCATLARRMFNGGMLLYRNDQKVMHWLGEWAALTERNARLGSMAKLPDIPFLQTVQSEQARRRLLFNDQISLAELLSPEVNRFNLAYRILDSYWNFRHVPDPQEKDHVKILHLPRELARNRW